ncbi:L,D-transpeptidase family protein [Tsuneonella sp. YG55]|uniref:L,D-transpeptidase family protein n=1 Tax=Tsuneonella litorea TaxID=2976475 RepID=A0A9X3ALY7_9SPHN|nr:L,D-transpeptidase family protein [Tsuneonella litorea]
MALATFPAPGLALDEQGQDGPSGADGHATAHGLEISLPDGVTMEMLGQRSLETVALQVMLDRSRHSPGVIDGYMGGNTRRAIRYYRQANGLPSGDRVDKPLLRSLVETQSGDIFRQYAITEEDLARSFDDNPQGFEEMAKRDRIGYETPLEMFAERFHMDRDFLAALNPEADFTQAGTRIVIVSHGDETLSADLDRIEVRKADNTVALFDGEGALVASYPSTIGSDEFPSPSGDMEVRAVAPEATYYFSPEGREWGPDKRLKIPPGPNNPVGGIWVDLTKEGYGIHGSPDPQMVGKRTSHGCVRLTNWDAHEVAGAVEKGVRVVFR